ncbi:hypothetical protein DL93DRAFT_2224587 [Clavulina sp. PMI_390]|nr:hypothetical protein DL93DRAFT_2224587 [Clavulina sp. PMI_390]
MSGRLRESIKQLGLSRKLPNRGLTPMEVVICCEESKLDVIASRQLLGSSEPTISLQEGDTSKVDRGVVKHTLSSFRWTMGEELPFPMSLYFIGLFLPHRSHFQFLIPLPFFVSRLSLSSSHPDSIHPCLRNACHLATCSLLGGDWTFLEPYFLQRTRYFLEQILVFADCEHFIDYLWASSLVASYFVRARRLQEGFVVIAAASQLAKPCGVFSISNLNCDVGPTKFLLPRPTTQVAALESIWLLQSLFMVDQSLSTLAAFPPNFIREDYLIPSFDHSDITYPSFEMPMTSEEDLLRVWQTDEHLAVSTTVIFRLVAKLPNLAEGSRATDTEALDVLRSFIRFHDSRIPSFSDAIRRLQPYTFLSYANLYGSSLILHSMLARENVRERNKMLQCARKLVDMCKGLRPHGHLCRIHISLVPMIHMMNAVRVFADELRTPKAQKNPRLSIEYCNHIEILLDFLSGITTLYPVWSECYSA